MTMNALSPQTLAFHLVHRLAEIDDASVEALLRLAARGRLNTTADRLDVGMWLALVRELRLLGLAGHTQVHPDQLVWLQASEALARAARFAEGAMTVAQWAQDEGLVGWIASEDDWRAAVAGRADHLCRVPDQMIDRRIEIITARSTPGLKAAFDEISLTLDDGVVVVFRSTASTGSDATSCLGFTCSENRSTQPDISESVDPLQALRWRTVERLEAVADGITLTFTDGAAAKFENAAAGIEVWSSPLEAWPNLKRPGTNR